MTPTTDIYAKDFAQAVSKAAEQMEQLALAGYQLADIPDEDLANIFAETREYIEEHGWTRGTLRDCKGQVCAVGGIIYSQGWDMGQVGTAISSEYQPMLNTAVAVLLQTLDPQSDLDFSRWGSVPNWNDQSDRTKQQVLDAFAHAEKTLRAGFDPDAA